MIKAFWYKSKNFGDQLTPEVLEFFLKDKVELVDRNESGKLMGIGSIMTALRNNDVVWGSGSIRQAKIKGFKNVKFLAVRGPLTRECLDGDVPEIYGDPALLLPLIYNPKIEKKYEWGVLPHYVDKEIAKERAEELLANRSYLFIDIEKPWREIINDMLSCKIIMTSSLHGIIASEAYGLDFRWMKYSDKIIGGNFKFKDYFLGTGRDYIKDGRIRPLENLKEKQDILIKVLKQHYGKN